LPARAVAVSGSGGGSTEAGAGAASHLSPVAASAAAVASVCSLSSAMPWPPARAYGRRLMPHQNITKRVNFNLVAGPPIASFTRTHLRSRSCYDAMLTPEQQVRVAIMSEEGIAPLTLTIEPIAPISRGRSAVAVYHYHDPARPPPSGWGTMRAVCTCRAARVTPADWPGDFAVLVSTIALFCCRKVVIARHSFQKAGAAHRGLQRDALARLKTGTGK
jgi:hypothetical protein